MTLTLAAAPCALPSLPDTALLAGQLAPASIAGYRPQRTQAARGLRLECEDGDGAGVGGGQQSGIGAPRSKAEAAPAEARGGRPTANPRWGVWGPYGKTAWCPLGGRTDARQARHAGGGI